MIYLRTICHLLFILFILTAISSCSHVQTPVRHRPPITPQLIAAPEKRHLSISQENPQKGIDGYKAECAKHPNDQSLAQEYIKGLEHLRTSADREAEKEAFTASGRLYNVLLENYQSFQAFSKMLSFDQDYLKTKLSYCKTILSRKGFEAYRKGNVSEAIGYWQDYLSIDPSDKDIKKAVDTASVQQKNLKHLQ
jgi:tetratricopeptide (TPR) repeat protein